jgi:hypothetical protein
MYIQPEQLQSLDNQQVLVNIKLAANISFFTIDSQLR